MPMIISVQVMRKGGLSFAFFGLALFSVAFPFLAAFDGFFCSLLSVVLKAMWWLLWCVCG